MPLEHIVRQGECISSIAENYGFFPDTVWDDAANADLRERRRDPNVLYPGDVVVIPGKREKEESGATEQRHRFRKKGVPERLHILLLDEEDEPIQKQSYLLEIDGKISEGTTTKDGEVRAVIPPGAKRGKVILTELGIEYSLKLGHIDPITEFSGVQARLNNLGFDCGIVDGVLGPKTERALKQFQKKYSLTESGKNDRQTQDKLKEIYGR